MAANSGKGEVLSTQSFLPLSQGLPTFGNYCGPGWSGGAQRDPKEPAVRMPGADGVWRESPVDKLCKIHDGEDNDAKGRVNERQLILASDQELLAGLKDLPWANLNRQEAAYATLMITAFTAKLAADASLSLFERAMNEVYQQIKQRITPEFGDIIYQDTLGNTVAIKLYDSPDFLMVSEEGAAKISMSVLDDEHIKMTTFSFGADGQLTSEATAVVSDSGEATVTVTGSGAVVEVNDATVAILENSSATIDGSNLDITVADGAHLELAGDGNIVSLGSETSVRGTGADNSLFFDSDDTRVTMNGADMAALMDGVVFDSFNNMLADFDAGSKNFDDDNKRNFFPALRRRPKGNQDSLQCSVDRMKERMVEFQLASGADVGSTGNLLTLTVNRLHRSLEFAAPNMERPRLQSGPIGTQWHALASPTPGATWLAVPRL